MTVFKASQQDMRMRVSQMLLELPQDYQILEAQWDRYVRAADAHRVWAEVAKLCVEFYENNQWSEAERAKLQAEGRPCRSFNKIRPLVNFVLGHFRQNRYDMRFLPGFDGSGIDSVAEVLNGITKQISEANQSNWNDAQVFQDGVMTGRGFWDIRLDFERNMLGEVVEAVEDPFDTLLDPESNDYDPNSMAGGWGYFFKQRWMSPMDIFLLFGEKNADAALADFKGIPIDTTSYESWLTEDMSPERYFGLNTVSDGRYDSRYAMYASPWHHINRNRKLVRVLDCQHRQLAKSRYFVNIENGNESVIPDTFSNDKITQALEYIRLEGLPIVVREGIRRRIRWTITAGDRVLHDQWSPYDRYTLVPFFPYFRRGKTRGMIEDLLDPQREVNMRRSAFLHITMTTANSGWIFEKGALDDEMQRALEEFGSRPGINIEYREGYNAPSKIQPSAIPQNVRQLEIDSASDMKEIASVNDSSLGNVDRVQSGKAIQARQKMSVLGHEGEFDNFSRSRELKGGNYLHIIQRYYTEPRIIQSRGLDGKDVRHEINMRDAAGQLVNNVTMGTFEVAIDETPVSASYNEGVFEEAMTMRRDLGIAIPDDIIVDMSSIARKDEIKQRLSQDRQLAENKAALENMQMRGQMQLPLDQPLPRVAVAEGGVTEALPPVMPQPPAMQMQPPMPQPPAPNVPPGLPPLPL